MGIIEEYDRISKEKLEEDPEIKNYKNNLEENILNLSNFKANSTIFTVLLHPIKTIKVGVTLNRLTTIKKEFEKIFNASLVEYMEEESGILEDDLNRAMLYTKPKYLKKFMEKKH